MEDLLKIAKQALSIIDTSTLKDEEIKMLINSGKIDLKRVGIDVGKKLKDELIITTIMLYVKANFGNTDMNERNEYLKRYKSNLRDLQLSQEYLLKEKRGRNARC